MESPAGRHCRQAQGIVIMPSLRALALVLFLTVPLVGAAAAPVPIGDPDKFSSAFMQSLSGRGARAAAVVVADAVGKPDVIDNLHKFLQVFDGKKFDFTKKVFDRSFGDALRQIVIYAFVPDFGFFYFRFNFKMTSGGWVLSHFTLKSETEELFPKDFIID
jgi:hypothetical protein